MPPLQLVFALRQPEQAEWTRDPEFNARVHESLLAARARILAATTTPPSAGAPSADGRRRAERDLLLLIAQPMSTRQRMLLYYLLAQCARGRNLARTAYFYQALEWLARAQELAGDARDYGALVDIHELCGTLRRAVSHYRQAAEEFALALRLLREHADDWASFDPEFEATVAAKAALMDYFVGRVPQALDHLRQAEQVLPLARMSLAGQGTHAWTLALLYRQRNEPREALYQAEMAIARYRALGAATSTCRILALAAEICLDIVESSVGADPAARASSLDQAERYAREARSVVETVDDPPGLALSDLALARLARLRDPGTANSPGARIRATIQLARHIGDDSLLTAAATALGEDLLAHGDITAGTRWLQRAVATAWRIHAPGLAFRAQRRLRQLAGLNV